MRDTHSEAFASDAIRSSWQRCERAYKLSRDAGRPILRLQSSEVAPRLEALIEQIGGRHGIFKNLARLAKEAGHCMVMTDNDGILVRLDGTGADKDWNGITIGSVWDERVAGTNGVSMALAERRAFTVDGKDHFYSKLQPFSCSAVPLRDANNEIIGVVSLSSIDRGNTTDGLFARQLLGAAASRLQSTLFERDFKDATIVSLAVPGRRELLKGAELVAVDEAGRVLGATSAAHSVAGLASHMDLTGCQFDEVFGTGLDNIDRVPGRVMSVRRDKGPLLDLWVRAPIGTQKPFPGLQRDAKKPMSRRLPPSLEDLCFGSPVMSAICQRAQESQDHGIPLLIEGETGTGKSALIDALLNAKHDVVTLDCAALSDTQEDRSYLRSLMEQARISARLGDAEVQPKALVFDNVGEMPDFAQVEVKRLLDELEQGFGPDDAALTLITTARSPIRQAVDAGTFRDDLYYRLSGLRLTLPPLRARKQPVQLATAMARQIAGQDVDITDEARQAITAYDWPGNLRELRNTLRQALLLGDGRRISELDLALAQPPFAAPRTSKTMAIFNEEAMIVDALHGARWNISKAARNLCIGRATIHRKMKVYGISRPG
ncbi:MAG: sigma 54-interacting transcriptional regulator [Pseudomonadota bacterium]